jgi:dGTPase
MVARDTEYKIYEMTDYIGKQKFDKALEILLDMLGKGEPPARIITSLYNYFMDHPDEIHGIYGTVREEEGTATAVKDLISGMTDRYAINMYEDLFVPQGWRQL